MSLDDLLGHAYSADQMQHSRAKAVALVRDAIKAEPETEAALRARYGLLQRTRAARRLGTGPGAKDGCHVTGVLCDILSAVFG